MSPEFLRTLRAEAAELQRELAEHPAHQKLEAINRLLALYASQTSPTPAETSALFAKAIRRGSRSGSLTSSVVQGAEAYLRRTGKRAQSVEIMKALVEDGQEFTSVNPLASLSSALSHCVLFDNKRGLGYGLTEWQGADRAPSILKAAPTEDVEASMIRSDTEFPAERSEHRFAELEGVLA